MPELPDVENYRRYLSATALHKKIDEVEVKEAKVLAHTTGPALGRALQGHRFERALRHGKYLLAELDDGAWVVFHFGMTGRLAYFQDLDDDPAHDRVRFDLDNGYHLAFEDQRLFGRLQVVSDADTFLEEHDLGPDALDLDEEELCQRLGHKSGTIKSALMDQSLLAGVGNVYSDEILFQAGVHPRTKAKELDDAQLRAVARAIPAVLEEAIASGAGTDEQRFPDTWLLPHREEGADCPRCGGQVQTLKAGSRTAYFCPRCQPKPG